MEQSKRAFGLVKGLYISSSPQRRRLRFQDAQEALEYEDNDEDLRYARSKQATRSVEGERTQPRRLGEDSRDA